MISQPGRISSRCLMGKAFFQFFEPALGIEKREKKRKLRKPFLRNSLSQFFFPFSFDFFFVKTCFGLGTYVFVWSYRSRCCFIVTLFLHFDSISSKTTKSKQPCQALFLEASPPIGSRSRSTQQLKVASKQSKLCLGHQLFKVKLVVYRSSLPGTQSEYKAIMET